MAKDMGRIKICKILLKWLSIRAYKKDMKDWWTCVWDRINETDETIWGASPLQLPVCTCFFWHCFYQIRDTNSRWFQPVTVSGHAPYLKKVISIIFCLRYICASFGSSLQIVLSVFMYEAVCAESRQLGFDNRTEMESKKFNSSQMTTHNHSNVWFYSIFSYWICIICLLKLDSLRLEIMKSVCLLRKSFHSSSSIYLTS